MLAFHSLCWCSNLLYVLLQREESKSDSHITLSTGLLVWFKCIWGELSLIFILQHCILPSRHHKTDFNPLVHIKQSGHVRRKNVKDVTRQKQTNHQTNKLTHRKTGMGRKVVLVYAEALPPSARMFLFTQCVAALPTWNINIWHPGNETQQSTLFPVHLQTTRTNLTGSN